MLEARRRSRDVVTAGTRGRRWFIAGAVCMLLAPVSVDGQASAPGTVAGMEPYLRALGLGPSQVAAAGNGQAVVRLLKTDDDRDVAVSGVVAVRASRDAVLAHALEGPAFMAARASRSGVFGDPATAADVRAVSFDNSEYRGLRNCRHGDCDFKLTAAAMKSYADDVDWSSPNAKAQADERLRNDLLQLVKDYRSRGNAALPVYDDARVAAHPGDVLAVLLAQPPDVAAYAPELRRYLETYPAERPDGVRDLVYWVEDRLPRMRPTLTVNHVMVYAPPNGTAFIARKQLYATHYFEGGLQLVAVVDGGTGAGAPSEAPVTYLIAVRRFRFDALPGGIFNVRGRVRSQLLDATRQDLMSARAELERIAATPDDAPALHEDARARSRKDDALRSVVGWPIGDTPRQQPRSETRQR